MEDSAHNPQPTRMDDDEWLEDDDQAATAHNQHRAENDHKQMVLLGENEGLQAGLHAGEKQGYDEGYMEESPRAFELGRVLGMAHVLLKVGGHGSEFKALETQVNHLEMVCASGAYWDSAHAHDVEEQVHLLFHTVQQVSWEVWRVVLE